MSSLPSVQVNHIPQSIEEFVAVRDQVAQTPQGGAAVMALALLLYAQDETLGRQCLAVAVDRERLQEGPKGYKGWELRVADSQLIHSQVAGRAYMLCSYIKGATPENGYELGSAPYEFEFSDNPYSGDVESGQYKVFAHTSGAAHPRPVTVRRNNRGLWKAYEWSSLLMGVIKPARQIDDDL